MTDQELTFRINVHESLKMLSVKMGKYATFCRAYAMKKVGENNYEYVNPKLKYDFDADMKPMLQEICGSRLGENPKNPNHPINAWKRFA